MCYLFKVLILVAAFWALFSNVILIIYIIHTKKLSLFQYVTHNFFLPTREF